MDFRGLYYQSVIFVQIEMAHNCFTVPQTIPFSSEKIEKIVRKIENAGYQHFALFPKYCQKVTVAEK